MAQRKTKVERRRIDQLLVDLALADSREKAQALVMSGAVLVNDQPVIKAGRAVPVDAEIRLKETPPYVSRGGLKLEGALDAFALDVTGMAAADVGASTGGFTDCLLQRGAASVVAIDVGYGQLAWKLRQDPRVLVIERTNVRYLDALPDDRLVDLAVVDVSFIGLELVLPAVARWLRPGGSAIVLIKPQFEAGRKQVGRGGIVRDEAVHGEVLRRVLTWSMENGWQPTALIASPITGTKGNVEFLAWLRWGVDGELPSLDTLLEAVVSTVPEVRLSP